MIRNHFFQQIKWKFLSGNKFDYSVIHYVQSSKFTFGHTVFSNKS